MKYTIDFHSTFVFLAQYGLFAAIDSYRRFKRLRKAGTPYIFLQVIREETHSYIFLTAISIVILIIEAVLKHNH